MSKRTYTGVTYLKQRGNFQTRTSAEDFWGGNLPKEKLSELIYSIETQAALLAISLYTCGETEHLPFINKDPDSPYPYLQLTETIRVYFTIDAETLEMYIDFYEDTRYI